MSIDCLDSLFLEYLSFLLGFLPFNLIFKSSLYIQCISFFSDIFYDYFLQLAN
jgi:hypothetical protein